MMRRHVKAPTAVRSASAGDLPERLRPFFWEHDFDSLSWEEDRHLVTARILAAGDWEAIRWLRGRMGDRALRAWIEARHGRGLDARDLRLWEVILRIPHRTVTEWLRDPGRQIWEGRRAR
jgi:hypothetical protein